ncbi:MAG: hypothetical protein MUD01_18065, partial [Chloroflexaceae bacterium]|nr:hypothetical protein [Chloroflexaceae bacterium]
MAEHFNGSTHTVHFSNSAAESLLRAWVMLGERLAPSAEQAAVVAFLRQRLHAHAAGWRAFSLAPPPPELAPPAHLRCLAQIIAAVAADLAREQPNPALTEVASNRDVRLSWLARMLDLYEFVGQALPADSAALAPLTLPLSPHDQRSCMLYRLENRRVAEERALHQQANPDQTRQLLALTDEIVALLAQEEP